MGSGLTAFRWQGRKVIVTVFLDAFASGLGPLGLAAALNQHKVDCAILIDSQPPPLISAAHGQDDSVERLVIAKPSS